MEAFVTAVLLASAEALLDVGAGDDPGLLPVEVGPAARARAVLREGGGGGDERVGELRGRRGDGRGGRAGRAGGEGKAGCPGRRLQEEATLQKINA